MSLVQFPSSSSRVQAGFYFAIGSAIAFAASPMYEGIVRLSVRPEDFTISMLAAFLGVAGAVSSILNVARLDKTIDTIIIMLANHGSILQLVTRKENRKTDPELMRYVAKADCLVESWREPWWISVEEECTRATKSVMENKQVQDTLWTSKANSATGLVLLISMIPLSPFLGVWGFVITAVGLIVMICSWLKADIHNLPSRVRKLGLLRHVRDSFEGRLTILGEDAVTESSPYMSLVQDPTEDLSLKEPPYTLKDALRAFADDIIEAEKVASQREWARFDKRYNWIVNGVEQQQLNYNVEIVLSEAWAQCYNRASKLQAIGEQWDQEVKQFLRIRDAYFLADLLKKDSVYLHLSDSDISDPEKLFSEATFGFLTTTIGFTSQLASMFGDLRNEDKLRWLKFIFLHDLYWTVWALDPLFGPIYEFLCEYEDNDLSDAVIIQFLYFLSGGATEIPMLDGIFEPSLNIPLEKTTSHLISRVFSLAENAQGSTLLLVSALNDSHVDIGVRKLVLDTALDGSNDELLRTIATMKLESFPEDLANDIRELRKRMGLGAFFN